MQYKTKVQLKSQIKKMMQQVINREIIVNEVSQCVRIELRQEGDDTFLIFANNILLVMYTDEYEGSFDDILQDLTNIKRLAKYKDFFNRV